MGKKPRPAREASAAVLRPSLLQGPPAGGPDGAPFLSLAAVLALALFLRLAFLWQVSGDIFSRRLIIDAQFYDEWAQRILRGEWLGRQAFYQDPLYAYFLAACYGALGRHLQAVRFVQVLLSLGALLLFYSISARLFGRRAGVIAAAIGAVYGPMVYYADLLDKTIFSLVLNVGGMALFGLARHRRRVSDLFASGVLFGLASWTRGNLLLVAGFLGAWTLWSGNETEELGPRLRRFAAFASGVILMVGLVTARNFWVSRDWVLLTSNSGLNFFIGNNPNTVGGYEPPPMVRGIPDFEYEDSRAYAEYVLGRKLDRASEVSRFYAARGLDFILRSPRAWAALAARKFFMMVNDLEEADTYSFYYFRDRYPSLRAAFLDFGMLCPLGLIGLARSIAKRRFNELHVFFFAYGASLVVFFVTSRYRFPLVVSLIPFAAGYLDESLSEWRTLPGIVWARRFAPLAALALLCHWTPGWMDAGVRRSALSTGYTLAGYEYYTEERNFPAAIRELEAAERINPADYLNYLYLADCHAQMGDDDEAAANYEAAVRINPLRSDAWNNIGTLRFKRERYAEALKAFETAVRLKPYEPRYRANYEVALNALKTRAKR